MFDLGILTSIQHMDGGHLDILLPMSFHHFNQPLYTGSSYVDVPLHVVVSTAPCTLSVFQPNVLHGTTESGGAINYGLSMTMTCHVYESYMEFIKAGNQLFLLLRLPTSIQWTLIAMRNR
jgi:hypothetical protein